ncbi:MAG: hypothetical protein NKF70_06485 [Methanobacterium sp. ERen5]|nr:MAG: hypothetical protein NKF70_06485 [Methanobacterium sp. ERen5]
MYLAIANLDIPIERINTLATGEMKKMSTEF